MRVTVSVSQILTKSRNIRDLGVDDAISNEVAKTLPRYLVPVPLDDQPEDVRTFARNGFSTVIVAPLETEAAVTLARTQVKELTNRDVPLMLFLDRITEISIEILSPDEKAEKRTMQRQERRWEVFLTRLMSVSTKSI